MTLLVGLITVLPLALEPFITSTLPLTTKDASVPKGGRGDILAPTP